MPALQAHWVLRYGEWRDVIAEYVAERRRLEPDDLMARMVGHVFLALELSAYEEWLESSDASLSLLLDEAMTLLVGYVGTRAVVGGALGEVPRNVPEKSQEAAGADRLRCVVLRRLCAQLPQVSRPCADCSFWIQ